MNHQNPNEQEIINKSGDVDLCQAVLAYSKNLLKNESIAMTNIQWLSFVSHISGMVYRSTNKESIPPIDKEIFSEVPQDSIQMARIICQQISNLQDDEKYLLSIHFEAAKSN